MPGMQLYGKGEWMPEAKFSYDDITNDRVKKMEVVSFLQEHAPALVIARASTRDGKGDITRCNKHELAGALKAYNKLRVTSAALSDDPRLQELNRRAELSFECECLLDASPEPAQVQSLMSMLEHAHVVADREYGTLPEMCKALPALSAAVLDERAAPLRESTAQVFTGKDVSAADFQGLEIVTKTLRNTPGFATFRKAVETTKREQPVWAELCDRLLVILANLEFAMIKAAPDHSIDQFMAYVFGEFLAMPLAKFLNSDIAAALGELEQKIADKMNERAHVLSDMEAAVERRDFLAKKTHMDKVNGLDKGLVGLNKQLRDSIKLYRSEPIVDELLVCKDNADEYCNNKVENYQGTVGRLETFMVQMKIQNQDIRDVQASANCVAQKRNELFKADITNEMATNASLTKKLAAVLAELNANETRIQDKHSTTRSRAPVSSRSCQRKQRKRSR